MEKNHKNRQGGETIAVCRQSSDAKGTASNEAQLDFMRKDLLSEGMRLVDAMMLDGVPGSAPARINEILEQLLRRKREKNDFDTVAWFLTDRASRGGGEHGIWLEHELIRAGIHVHFAGEEEHEGPYGAVVRLIAYEAAKEAAVNIGRRAAQGQNWAQQQGFFRTSGPTPFGCDRLYLSDEDKPKFTIRNLLSGLQEQREWGTGKLIGTFGTTGRKSHNRLRKQRNEYSLLVPGDRQQQKVVRVVFYLRYKKGWRGHRICDLLNRNRVAAPKGGKWSKRQVEVLYENAAYTGVTYNNQTYSGRFFRRDREQGFTALDRDERELVLKKTFVPKLRPMDEWQRIDQPYMYEFLPRDVRDLASAAQATLWQERADPARPKRKTNAHPASDYFLSGMLKAVQDGKFLTGTQHGPAKGPKVKYYRHREGRKVQRGSEFGNLIPAKPLHEELLRIVGETLTNVPELRQRLLKHLVEQRQRAVEDQPDVAALETEREELTARINLIVTSISGAALEEVRSELTRLGQRRNQIEAMLADLKGSKQQEKRSPEEVVEDAIRVLAEQTQSLATLPPVPLRELIRQLIIEPTVDMETKEVRLKVGVPVWALAPAQKVQKKGKKGTQGMGPVTSTPSPTGQNTPEPKAWAVGGESLVLTEVTCRYIHLRGSRAPACYECRRKAA